MKKHLFFENSLDEMKKALSNAKAELEKCPEGVLNVENRAGKTLYFVKSKEKGSRRRLLINKNPELIGELARKAYLESEIRLLEKNIELFEKMYKTFSEQYEAPTVSNVYKHMQGKYQDIAYKAYYKDIEELQAKMPIDFSRYSRDIIEWVNQDYERADYKAEGRRHRTSLGLKVRSKSEVTISEQVYKYMVPFRHDMVIRTPDFIMIPDFVLPGADGTIYYWEHCGMTHDKEYMARHKKKLEQYESIGIVPWKNLIVTYDNEYGDIDVAIIDSEIRNKLL